MTTNTAQALAAKLREAVDARKHDVGYVEDFVALMRQAADALAQPEPQRDFRDAFLKAQEEADALRQALEVISVGDSENPVRDAGDLLVERGHWDAEAVSQMRAQQPEPQGAELSDLIARLQGTAAGLRYNGAERSAKAVDEAIRALTARAPGEPVATIEHTVGGGLRTCGLKAGWDLPMGVEFKLYLAGRAPAEGAREIVQAEPWLKASEVRARLERGE